MATKTVVVGKSCAPHGRKAEKCFWRKRDANRLRSYIFDSPGVEVFHIVTVLLFGVAKQSPKMDELPTTWHLLSP